MSFSERHQKLVDENFRKSLHIQILNKLERQARNQIVQNENDERVERKRFLRVLQNEQFELDMEEAIQKVSFSVRCNFLHMENLEDDCQFWS